MDKIAVVVVETYSAKLIIANYVQDNFFSICDVEIEPIQFGLEMDEDHFLKKNQIMSIISTLKNFRKICDMYSVNKTIAIADFVKDTKPMNIYSFFDEVFVTCGFRFSLMTPEEQNSAIYTGVMNSYDIPKAVIVNVGADNIHIIHYNRRNILNQAFIPVGPRNLIEMYPLSKYGKEEAFEKVSKYINAQLSDFEWLSNIEPEFVLVGNGPYFEDLSSMDRIYKKYPLDRDDGYVFETADVEHILNQLKAIDLNENKRLKNLYESRADVFAYAVEVMKTIVDAVNRETITITTRSLVEGILFNNVIPSTTEKPNSDIVGFSVMAQTSEFEADSAKHNEQVYNLSMLLFKQLRVLHKLPRGYVKILRVASYMHDVGKRISYKNHARHSFEVVINSEIYGLTHRELVLASFVASLHAGGEIKMADWARYNGILTEEDVDATKKLGIILRLAECFDRTKNNAIVDINCDILGDSVIMKTITTADATFEIQRGMEVGRDFERIFHKKLEIL
ncbi:MAG: hypothetical protein IJ538_04705 [Clostridia bacterium]|nr:hypothetical protein [Clostridia bacterium]